MSRFRVILMYWLTYSLTRIHHRRKIFRSIQNFQIQMVNYKTPENIPFKYNPFKKHPPKLGVSYSIILECWFGGMRMASGGPGVGVCLCV
jgi:hypothetical protein